MARTTQAAYDGRRPLADDDDRVGRVLRREPVRRAERGRVGERRVAREQLVVAVAGEGGLERVAVGIVGHGRKVADGAATYVERRDGDVHAAAMARTRRRAAARASEKEPSPWPRCPPPPTPISTPPPTSSSPSSATSTATTVGSCRPPSPTSRSSTAGQGDGTLSRFKFRLGGKTTEERTLTTETNPGVIREQVLGRDMVTEFRVVRRGRGLAGVDRHHLDRARTPSSGSSSGSSLRPLLRRVYVQELELLAAYAPSVAGSPVGGAPAASVAVSNRR